MDDGDKLMNKSRSAVEEISQNWNDLLKECGFYPQADSIGRTEIANADCGTTLETGTAIVSMLAVYIHDHLGCFSNLLKEEVPVFAVTTCVRSTLEAAALVCWLYDPEIDYRERARRIYLYRLECAYEMGELAEAFEQSSSVNTRIQKIVEKASCEGFEIQLPRRGMQVIIDGAIKPGATKLIETQLKDKKAYKWLSKIAHANYSAILDIGFERHQTQANTSDITGQLMPKIEQTLKPLVIFYCSTALFLAVTRVVWYQANYLGWNKLITEEFIERAADALVIPDEDRFWRSFDANANSK